MVLFVVGHCPILEVGFGLAQKPVFFLEYAQTRLLASGYLSVRNAVLEMMDLQALTEYKRLVG